MGSMRKNVTDGLTEAILKDQSVGPTTENKPSRSGPTQERKKGSMETRKQDIKERRKQENTETRKQEKKETRKQGNKETRKQECKKEEGQAGRMKPMMGSMRKIVAD